MSCHVTGYTITRYVRLNHDTRDCDQDHDGRILLYALDADRNVLLAALFLAWLQRQDFN